MNNEYEFFKQFAGVTEEDLHAYKCGGKTKKIKKDCGGGCAFKIKGAKGMELKNAPGNLGNSNKKPLDKIGSGSLKDVNSKNPSSIMPYKNNIKNSINNNKNKGPYDPKKDPTNDKINGPFKKNPFKDDKINAPERKQRFKSI